mmetsp:Transcript_1103/g.3442  ORF Transcript_1103/g.3442 Transcript_1103/m.3442 type:complete len:131 (+) Transcript_1103:1897-2289(+)
MNPRASTPKALSSFPTSCQSSRTIGSSARGEAADSAEDIVESPATVGMEDPVILDPEIADLETEIAAPEVGEGTSAAVEDGETGSMTGEEGGTSAERGQADGEAAGLRSMTGLALVAASTGSDKSSFDET